MNNQKLPSTYQFGDTVSANFHHFGHVKNAVIVKIHFENSGKVLYDLLLSCKEFTTRLYNVEEKFIK